MDDISMIEIRPNVSDNITIQDVFDYVTNTPENTNPNVLKSMLEDKPFGSDELFNYILQVKDNINLAIVKSIIEKADQNSSSDLGPPSNLNFN